MNDEIDKVSKEKETNHLTQEMKANKYGLHP